MVLTKETERKLGEKIDRVVLNAKAFKGMTVNNDRHPQARQQANLVSAACQELNEYVQHLVDDIVYV